MRHERPLLSIVVETWNQDPGHNIGLRQSLGALARQTIPIERCEVLIVVPETSGELVEVVREALPGARVLAPDRALGYGQMKMHGAWAAAGDIVALTDADCVVEPDWAAAVLDGFRDAPATVGVLQGLTRHADGPGWQAATLLYCRSMWSPARRGRNVVLNNFAIRRALFERFPFANVRARQGVERLMVRAMSAGGYEIRIEPRMRATHSYRGGLMAWFQRGRAEAFDRLETLRLIYPLIEPPEQVARLCRLRSRLRHQTRRCLDVMRDLIRCRHELGVGPGAFLMSGLAAVTIWAGACVGAWQASRGGPRPPTAF
jgi:glycosyltransferase involved in cell wall biosynthesis